MIGRKRERASVLQPAPARSQPRLGCCTLPDLTWPDLGTRSVGLAWLAHVLISRREPGAKTRQAKVKTLAPSRPNAVYLLSSPFLVMSLVRSRMLPPTHHSKYHHDGGFHLTLADCTLLKRPTSGKHGATIHRNNFDFAFARFDVPVSATLVMRTSTMPYHTLSGYLRYSTGWGLSLFVGGNKQLATPVANLFPTNSFIDGRMRYMTGTCLK